MGRGDADAAGPGRISVPMVGRRNPNPASSRAPLPTGEREAGPVISFETESARRHGRGAEVARTWPRWDGEGDDGFAGEERRGRYG